jgi:RNA polymerase sigma factor (sigma-70 family)
MAPAEAMTARNALSVESVWDIVGDIVLRIHQHLDDLADHERLTAWLFRIARNAVTDHYRRTGRRRELLDADPEPREAASSADSWLDDQDAVYAELAGCIRPLVEALPADYRRALELTDFEGRTQAEAARLEGISLSVAAATSLPMPAVALSTSSAAATDVEAANPVRSHWEPPGVVVGWCHRVQTSVRSTGRRLRPSTISGIRALPPR